MPLGFLLPRLVILSHSWIPPVSLVSPPLSRALPEHFGMSELQVPALHLILWVPRRMYPGLQANSPTQMSPSPSPRTHPFSTWGGEHCSSSSCSPDRKKNWGHALSASLFDDVTKFSTISLYFTKLYVAYIELCNSDISHIQRNQSKVFLQCAWILNTRGRFHPLHVEIFWRLPEDNTLTHISHTQIHYNL